MYGATRGPLEITDHLLVAESALLHVRSFLGKRTLLVFSWYALQGAGHDAQPVIPADRLRRPLNSNVGRHKPIPFDQQMEAHRE